MSGHPILNLSRSTTDKRDYIVKVGTGQKLTTEFSLEKNCPAVFDQGNIGSCTANAVSTAFSFLNKKKTGYQFIPSRLFIYYNTRVLEGNPSQDNGATLRNTLRSVQKWGACSEDKWIYDQFLLFQKPSPQSYTDAMKHQVLVYSRVQLNIMHMKSVLAEGLPFVMGIAVYSSFMSDKTRTTGIVSYPDVNSEELLGGHAICVIGYSDSRQSFLVRNSWGINWGVAGNFWLPYRYAIDPHLSFDAWLIADIETVNTTGLRLIIPHKTYIPI